MVRRTTKKGTVRRVEEVRPAYRGCDAYELDKLQDLRTRYEQGLMRVLGLRMGPARKGRSRVGERCRKTPFDKMLTKGQVSARQYAAGERLRADWLIVAMGQGGADITVRALYVGGSACEFVMVDSEVMLEGGESVAVRQKRPVTFPPRRVKEVRGGGGMSKSDYVLDASQRLKGAAKALPADVYDLLVEICGRECSLSSLTGSGREKSRISRRMKNGLDRLADHYKMPKPRRNGVQGVGYGDYKGDFYDPTDEGYEEAVRG